MAFETVSGAKAAPSITGIAAVPRRLTGAAAMLRLLLFSLFIVPSVCAGIAGYVSYQYRYDEAIEAMSAAVATAAENTAKMFDKYRLVATHINDLLVTTNSLQIDSSKKALHDAMSRQIADVGEVAAAWVIDATGHELVSARVYPVNRDLEQSGRDDYRALREGGAPTFIWILRAHGIGSGDVQPYVTVSVRRTSPDGRFDGVIIVAVASSYFASFYKALLTMPDYTVDLLRSDGTILTQYPAQELSTQPPLPDPLLAKAIGAGGETGIADRGTPFDGSGRIVAVRRVADYPIYLAIERSKASLRNEWLGSIAGAFAIGVVAMIVLVALTRTALHRARRETSALAAAAEAFTDRATLEVRLHRAQRHEAVALVATGTAYALDRLLTNAQDHVERLADVAGSFDTEQKLIGSLKEGHTQASVLIKRLLGYAYHEPIKPQPIDINEVIVRSLERTRQFADNVAREARLQTNIWLTCVDGDQLTIALLDFVFNADDVFGKAGKMIVGTTNVRVDESEVAELQQVAPGEYVVLFIEETWAGNPSEISETALEAPLTMSGPDKVGWLSRSLIQELVKGARGYLTISSEPARTAIRIYFPRHAAASSGSLRSSH
jgi:two-component system, NtrC family, sensor kinase